MSNSKFLYSVRELKGTAREEGKSKNESALTICVNDARNQLSGLSLER